MVVKTAKKSTEKKKVVAKGDKKEKNIPKPTSEKKVDMPMGREGDDVEEDHKVFDMSSIAAPVIEFEMPNLGEMKPSKEDDKIKTTKKEVTEKNTKKDTKKAGRVEKETLNAEKLNNEIVNLRSVIGQAKTRLTSKLVRKKKELTTKMTKTTNEKQKEELERKTTRLGEELGDIKTVDKDTVSKFALLNRKSLNELRIEASTPVAERLMYKMACEDIVVAAVEVLRQKYNDFDASAAFLLQRLGLQYAGLKKEKTEKAKENGETQTAKKKTEVSSKKTEEEETATSHDDDSEKNYAEENDVDVDVDGEGDAEMNMSDVEIVDSDEEAEEEAAKKRRDLLLGLIGTKEDKTRPKLQPKPRKVTEENEEGEETKTVEKKSKEATKETMKKVLQKTLSSVEVKKPIQEKKKNGKTTKNQKAVQEVKGVEEDEETEGTSQTMIRTVKLSEGGTIEKSSSAPVKKAENVQKVQAEEAEEEEEDEEEAAFFVNKPKTTAPKARNTLKRKAAEDVKKSGPVPKKQQKTAPARKQNPVEVKKQGKFREKVEEVPEKTKGSSKKHGSNKDKVHPSWTARQNQKKEQQSAVPCGKKIKFDDDE